MTEQRVQLGGLDNSKAKAVAEAEADSGRWRRLGVGHQSKPQQNS